MFKCLDRILQVDQPAQESEDEDVASVVSERSLGSLLSIEHAGLFEEAPFELNNPIAREYSSVFGPRLLI